jgi:DNA-binding NarL/FixJ family response regulator
VILDLELPDMSGIDAIPQITSAAPGAKVIVFTAYDTDERVLGAIKAGARGYLLKGAPADEIARAVRAAQAGGSHLASRIAAKVMAEATSPRRRRLLTEREHEILRLVADGLSTKQIGRRLLITERTVKFHVASIFNKLGASNRAQAVAQAVQRGLI